jgi:hypothetical protein
MNDIDYKTSKLFDYKEKCLKHKVLHCDECSDAQAVLDDPDQSPAAITLYPVRQDLSIPEKEQSQSKFFKQVNFVQVALGMTDTQIDHEKVKDLSSLIARAKEDITIGNMKKLLSSDKRAIASLGVVGRFFVSLYGKIFAGIVAIVAIIVGKAIFKS